MDQPTRCWGPVTRPIGKFIDELNASSTIAAIPYGIFIECYVDVNWNFGAEARFACGITLPCFEAQRFHHSLERTWSSYAFIDDDFAIPGLCWRWREEVKQEGVNRKEVSSTMVPRSHPILIIMISCI